MELSTHVEEIEDAYGPYSEHAAAIGIELRQRTRKPGESRHTLRDDIYEKVSTAYAGRGELEQEAVSVEIFTNAMADAELVQKLLEKNPGRNLRHSPQVRNHQKGRTGSHSTDALKGSKCHQKEYQSSYST